MDGPENVSTCKQYSNEVIYESNSEDLRSKMCMYMGDNKDLHGDMSMTNEQLL